jgi:hypothetical protein
MSPGINNSVSYRDPHQNISMQVISSKDYMAPMQNNSFTEVEVHHTHSLKKNDTAKLRPAENVEASTRYKTAILDPKQDMR